MASTSLSLGKHWEEFIKGEIASGRYASASEVIRDALRELEQRRQKFEALKQHLAEGEGQALAGELIEEFSMDRFIKELDEGKTDSKGSN